MRTTTLLTKRISPFSPRISPAGGLFWDAEDMMANKYDNNGRQSVTIKTV